MKIFLMTGPSASGKSTIAEQISSNLQIPIIREREILHRIALSQGFSRTRHWLAAVGVDEALNEALTKTLSSVGEIEQEGVILDGSYDARLTQALNKEGNEVFIIAISTREELRRERIAKRMGVDPDEALAEMRFIDEFKYKSGMAEIVEKADVTIDNNLSLDEAIRQLQLRLESELAYRRSGPERMSN